MCTRKVEICGCKEICRGSLQIERKSFDEYPVKRNLSAMENLFAGYINVRLDMYLNMMQD